MEQILFPCNAIATKTGSIISIVTGLQALKVKVILEFDCYLCSTIDPYCGAKVRH